MSFTFIFLVTNNCIGFKYNFKMQFNVIHVGNIAMS